MNRVIIRRSRAKSDVLEIAEYISRDSISSAERFLTKVEETLELLLQFPEIGTLWDPQKTRFEGLRWMSVKGFGKYLIFYRSTPEGIEVIRVLQGVRNFGSLLE
jgi:toxin ParE1/3/4